MALRERVDPAELLARLGFTPIEDPRAIIGAAGCDTTGVAESKPAGTPEDATAESGKDGGRRVT